MSTYTGRRHSPQGLHNTAGKRNTDFSPQAQHGVVPGRRAEAVNQPFPNKPVSHRRSLQPTKQDAFVPYDLEKKTITKQPRTQEHRSNGTGKTNKYQDPRKDSGGRRPSGELQMARAIHAKELVLQEKLWRVEEKIRQKIQRDTAALDDQKSEEQRHYRGQAERGNNQTTSRREPERRREVKMQESRQEDVKQHMKTRDQEERARGKRRETEVAQSHKNGHKATHQITDPEQEVGGELNKPWWEKVKEHTGRKERDERKIWGDTGVKSQDGTVKAKERHQNTASVGDTGWKRETQYREKESSDDERDTPQTSQQKASHKAATEGRKPSGAPRPPPASPPSRPEPEELRQEGLQLLLCKICNRKFAADRLQKHVQICEKVKQSQRGVFNAYLNRTKGSALEEYLKTHGKSPEVLKKNNQRQNQVHTRNLHKGRLPGGTTHQPK